ncbi:hypothetical protein IMCC3088_828 [Aequoribacter fuscus]|uniref:Uncharacterized protein n=1 Tax=Aequoribacter fuscus TaxID=2518989 RepID=F3L0B2_9GAMM|nr:hypothetical protein IMCC3088_828 [Aequoribacter fuscus]
MDGLIKRFCVPLAFAVVTLGWVLYHHRKPEAFCDNRWLYTATNPG